MHILSPFSTIVQVPTRQGLLLPQGDGVAEPALAVVVRNDWEVLAEELLVLVVAVVVVVVVVVVLDTVIITTQLSLILNYICYKL